MSPAYTGIALFGTTRLKKLTDHAITLRRLPGNTLHSDGVLLATSLAMATRSVGNIYPDLAFKRLLSKYFPEYPVGGVVLSDQPPTCTDIRGLLEKEFLANKLSINPGLVDAAVALHRALDATPIVALVGPACAGKTTHSYDVTNPLLL